MPGGRHATGGYLKVLSVGCCAGFATGEAVFLRCLIIGALLGMMIVTGRYEYDPTISPLRQIRVLSL